MVRCNAEGLAQRCLRFGELLLLDQCSAQGKMSDNEIGLQADLLAEGSLRGGEFLLVQQRPTERIVRPLVRRLQSN